MIKPKRLKKGSRIGFVCPSNVIEKEKFQYVEKAIEKVLYISLMNL